MPKTGSGCPQDHGADVFSGGRLENVCSAAGAIAHVVAHQVSNHGWIARIVFGNACFDLAHEVGAHVSGLGIDSSAELGEEGDQGRSEAKTHQLIGNVLRIL